MNYKRWNDMRKGMRVWNKEAKKVAYFVKKDSEYVYVRIDGLVTPIKKEKFEKNYEVLDEA